jgi:hypothetical protein
MPQVAAEDSVYLLAIVLSVPSTPNSELLAYYALYFSTYDEQRCIATVDESSDTCMICDYWQDTVANMPPLHTPSLKSLDQLRPFAEK